MQRRGKHTSTTIELLLETVFSIRSVQRSYKKDNWGDPVNKQKSYGIMKMNMFAVLGKVKPDIENVRGLNFEVVKLTTVQVTKLSL
jgi:hypothetical protein